VEVNLGGRADGGRAGGFRADGGREQMEVESRWK